MKCCLIVIDVQESFRHRPYSTERDMAPYLGAQNALIEGCVAANVPVVRVLHTDGPEVAGRPLAAADIKARTATVLEGRFAHVCGVDEALARLGETVGA